MGQDLSARHVCVSMMFMNIIIFLFLQTLRINSRFDWDFFAWVREGTL